MRRTARWLLVIAVLLAVGCSRSARTPGGDERGARLNEAKDRASQLLEAGNYRAAADVLGPLAEEASGDAQVFVMLGDARSRLDDYKGAVKSYESAIRLAYSSHEAHLKLATLLMKHERTGRALTEFELALKYGDRKPLTHYNYGLALHGMDREEEALREWRLAHEMDAQNARYAEAVGIGLTGVDDEEAVRHFEKARRLGADSDTFHNNFGLALQRLERYVEAEVEFTRAVEASPENEEYQFNRAALHMRSGSFRQAAIVWQGMIGRWGARWSYSVYLARAQLALGHSGDAMATLDQIAQDHDAGRLDPDVVDRVPPELHEAMEILALAARAAGSFPASQGFMRRALELDPGNVAYLNNYGVILVESGMLAEAKLQWQKVLEIDEDNATALENLSRFGP